MSGNPARTAILQRLQKILKRWPGDPIRPRLLLRHVLDERLAKGVLTPNAPGSLTRSEKEALDQKQVDALEALVENRYQKKFQLGTRMMQPRSNPEHYNIMMRELEEAPGRSFFKRILLQLRGKFR